MWVWNTHDKGLTEAVRGVPGAERSKEGKSLNHGQARVQGRGQKRLGSDGGGI